MLSAFQANPSIGGFGSESQLFGPSPFAPARSRIGDKHKTKGGRRSGDVAGKTAESLADSARVDNTGQFGAGSCDAFAQIVKELVDNAVDACASVEGNASQEEKTMKRVRVTMTSVAIPVRTNDKDCENSAGENTKDCLRIEVSDNGCGMENIDDCVSAFSSSKNGGTSKHNNNGDKGQKTGEESSKFNAKTKKGSKQKFTAKQSPSDSKENYTSGRYGIGLTLCLIHAQRLVPGTGACITSATASANEWTRATYEPDAGEDNIVCKKKECFPKLDGESGTTISLLVPGGEEAQRAWPRLAEYFARFQLSIDLPCSLEVKAPTMQSRPLYIRPPAEIERRIKRRSRMRLASADRLMDGSDTNSDDEEHSSMGNWDGGDGFDDLDPNTTSPEPKASKAAQQRADADIQKKKKVSLFCKAAQVYKHRPDLNVQNVAYTSQPIRRSTGSGQPASSKNGPVLEIGLIVFGPKFGNDSNDGNESCEDSCLPNQNHPHQSDSTRSKLHIVRMVNGIPLLDSSEALACGIMQKVSNNAALWNSFGLNVLQSSENDLDPVPLNEQNTPTFELDDSAQVAPFLRSSTHSLFQDPTQQYDESSSDEDDFENYRGKRKKERGVKCILPASLRLGDVLMVVQIRAKPSALPLPTLSKGRLPMNDRGIVDALENGISDCLRCLQRSSPGLLLTAHQLKKVERDVRYVPSVAAAITSVLCRSKRRSVHDNAMHVASKWDDEVKRMGILCQGNEIKSTQRNGRLRSSARSDDKMKTQADEERLRADQLCPILERRLRFVISDEFKDAKKSEIKEQQRREREEIVAAKKRAKMIEVAKSDDMNSDCFSAHSSLAKSTRDAPMKSSCHDFDSDASSCHNRRRRGGSSISSSERSSVASIRREKCQKDSSHSSVSDRNHTDRTQNHLRSGENTSSPQKSYRGNISSDLGSPVMQTGLVNSVDGFGDGYESSPRISKGWPENQIDASNERRRLAPSNHVANQSELERGESAQSQKQPSPGHDDSFSSDSDWSSQFGEVVAGHFFR